MRILTFLCLIFSIFAALAGIALVVFGLVERAQIATTGGILLLILPWLLYAVVRHFAVLQGKAAFEAALKVGTFTADESEWFFGSGIAYEAVGNRFLLAGPRQLQVYPATAIKGTRLDTLPGGSTTPAGAGVGGILGAVLLVFAMFSAATNYFASGLFVTTADRTWHMFGIKPSQVARWQQRLADAQALIAPPA